MLCHDLHTSKYTLILYFQLISVTPIDEDPTLGCSASASVAFSAKSWTKGQSIITAEDINSPGHLLR